MLTKEEGDKRQALLDAAVERFRDIDPVVYAANAIEQFDYLRYAECKNLSVAEWREELVHRARSLDWGIDRADRKYLPLMLESLSMRPIGAYLEDRSNYAPSVEDVTICQAWAAREMIEAMPLEANACRLWDEDMNTTQGPVGLDLNDVEAIRQVLAESNAREERYSRIHDSYNDALAEHDVDEGGAFVFVQLAAPDEVIVGHFRSWLAASRKKFAQLDQSPVAKFSEADLRRWAQHRVLGYLDLVIFAKVAGVDLTNYKIGTLLFPDITDVDLTEKVRKSTAPLAMELISSAMLIALSHASNALKR